MQQRIDVSKVSPAAYQAVATLQSYVDKSGLDAKLRELIKIRISQINGWRLLSCDAHTRRAHARRNRRAQASAQRLARSAGLQRARARCAGLGWVEAITLLTQGHVPDDVFEAARQEFSEKEIVDLTAAAIAIDSWNRIAIAFRVPPQVQGKKAAA